MQAYEENRIRCLEYNQGCGCGTSQRTLCSHAKWTGIEYLIIDLKEKESSMLQIQEMKWFLVHQENSVSGEL